jgi:hypothetical protein
MKRFFKRKFRTEKKFWSKIELKKKNIFFSQKDFWRNVRYFLCLSSIKRFVIIDHYQIEQRQRNTSIGMKFVFISQILWIPGIRGLLWFTVVSNFKVEWNYNFISNWRLEISAFRLLVTHWLLSFLAPLLSLTPSNHALKASSPSLSNDVFWEWVKLNFFHKLSSVQQQSMTTLTIYVNFQWIISDVW